MGLFDFFKRKPITDTPAPSSDDLRRLLFAAVNDPNRLLGLCKKHKELIATFASDWTTVPIQIRQNPALINDYVQSIMTVATFLKDQLGDHRCYDVLTARATDNPLDRIESTLVRASALATEFETEQAAQILSDLLIETRQLTFFGPHSLRGKIHGQLGTILFHAGKCREGLGHFEQALRICREQGDADGERAYLASLLEAHRYLGDPDSAFAFAEELRQFCHSKGDSDAARQFEAAAKRCRVGEPLVRLMAKIGEQTFELDEFVLPKNASVQVVFVRNRITLENSQRLTQQGRDEGAAGRDDEALSFYRSAAKVDPFNPEPHYLAGFSLLRLERFHEAIEEYETTERLAPGWFHVRADLWLARELAMGRLEHAVFLGSWFLADSDAPASEKLDMVEKMLEKWPQVPLLHLLYGQILGTLDRNEDAIAALRTGLSVDPEKDVKTRLLSELAYRTQDKSERRDLLEQAIAVNGNLMAAAFAKIMLRA